MYQIIMSSANLERPFASGLTYNEALAICENYGWEWMDENGFVWDLEIDEDVEVIL